MKTHVVHARSAASQPPASKPGQVPRNPHVVFPSDSEGAMVERFVRTPAPVGAGPRMGFARSFVGKKRRQEAEEVRPEGEQGRFPRIFHLVTGSTPKLSTGPDEVRQTLDAASTRICVFPHV